MRRLELILAMCVSVGGHAAVLLPGRASTEADAAFRRGDCAVTIRIVPSAESRAPRPGPEVRVPPEAVVQPMQAPPTPSSPPAAAPAAQAGRVALLNLADSKRLRRAERELADRARQVTEMVRNAADWLARAEPPEPPAAAAASPQPEHQEAAPQAPQAVLASHSAADPTAPAPAAEPPGPAPTAPTGPADDRGRNSRAVEGAVGRQGAATGAREDGTIHVAYPHLSRRRGEEGKVVLQWQVLPSGQAGWVKVLTGSGYHRLDEAAVEAVRNARFLPATRNGSPVESTMIRAFRFQLTDPEF